MNRHFISFATFACLVAMVVREVTTIIVDVTRFVIHAVATTSAYVWARLALPKIVGFKVIGVLKRVYRESFLTSGQSLDTRRSIYC